MTTAAGGKFEFEKFKDIFIKEIFDTYQEVEILYQKVSDAESKRTLVEIRRCLDLTLQNMSPLCAASQQRWEKLRSTFSTRDTAFFKKSSTSDHSTTHIGF